MQAPPVCRFDRSGNGRGAARPPQARGLAGHASFGKIDSPMLAALQPTA
jgi:hypothetical protein